MHIFEGYKSYITAAALVVVGIVRSQNLMDEPTFQAVLAVLLGTGIAAVRMGVTREAEKVEETIREKRGK